MRGVCGLALILFLSGCVSPSSIQPAEPTNEQLYPHNYRADLVAKIKGLVKDPYSIRSSEISNPQSGFVGILRGGSAPVICVRFNGKNSFGAYTGVRPWAFVYRNGQIADVITENPLACDNRVWEPFPELEQDNPDIQRPEKPARRKTS